MIRTLAMRFVGRKHAMARRKGNSKGPGGSTGPTSLMGKTASGKNSTKHGCTARKTLILADETQEEFDALREDWINEFLPQTHATWRLLEKLIRADWQHERTQRKYEEAEVKTYAEHGDDPMGWPEEAHHKLQLMSRYRLTAERSFYKAWNALQALRKDIERLDARFDAYLNDWLKRTRKAEAEEATKNPAANRPVAMSPQARGNGVVKAAGAQESPKTLVQVPDRELRAQRKDLSTASCSKGSGASCRYP